MCVSTGPQRSAAIFSIGGTPGPSCDAHFELDMNAFAAGLAGGNPAPFLAIVGQRVDAQVWGCDSVAAGSFLSDAVAYTVCP